MDNTLLNLSDISFPVSIIEHKKNKLGRIFKAHLHKNHIQIFYFKEGSVSLFCNNKSYIINSPDMFLINNNQIHYAESLSETLYYYVIRINLSMISKYNITVCNEKYIYPLQNNLIVLKNNINDEKIFNMIADLICIYKTKNIGYEFKLISCVFDILYQLFNNYTDTSFSIKSVTELSSKLKRFNDVISYINNNYDNKITTKKLAEIAYMSESHFCRQFKQTIGKTPMDYINRIRIEKAALLLNQGTCNITNAALSVGYNDINYFCRIFKKYMSISPSEYVKDTRRYFI